MAEHGSVYPGNTRRTGAGKITLGKTIFVTKKNNLDQRHMPFSLDIKKRSFNFEFISVFLVRPPLCIQIFMKLRGEGL